MEKNIKSLLIPVILAMLASQAIAGDKGGAWEAMPVGGLPTNITAQVNLSGYSFAPENGSLVIDQAHPDASARIVLSRGDHRMPFGTPIPMWTGSAEIPLTDEYRVKIRAEYFHGKPAADFTLDENGLTVDVYYYHGQQLLDYESASAWSKAQKQNVGTTLKDIPYCGLLAQNSFEIPSEFGGYGDDGFRFWAAVRDGLDKRDGHGDFDSLSKFLEPLNRKRNLIIPQIQVKCVVANLSEAKPADSAQPQSSTKPKDGTK